MNTIGQLIERRAAESPDAPAILSVDGRTLTYRELAVKVRVAATALRDAGVDASCRVAITLPNGPDLAIALLGAFSVGQCAPLNPAYNEREFEFYFGDLGARVLVVPEGAGAAARAAAAKLGIPVLELRNGQLTGRSAGNSPARAPRESDIALVLHTSGTTSRPKLVLLTHRNVCVSARNIRAAFDLGSADRCLQVMPLFHVHGLVGALLSSIVAGASVVCTPGFDAQRFRGWLDEFRPTWYTAVPTIHQAVLPCVRDLHTHSLRFIRSCSSPLAPAVMSALESAFGVPVVESYGMTEGAHQIATNPLPPLARKPGSVGRAAGPEIAVLGDDGRPLGAGGQGEVALRGVTITAGYAANPEANAAAFTDGWFRTGDRGYLDDEGYLFLAGRIKEIINRGGEKISPREIDEAFLEHPAVAEALAFAIPDALMGEEIGAAIVLKPGAAAGESELREHAAARLAYFKLPRRILIVDRIPKGPTGKAQRIGLAAKLDLSERAAAVHRAPATAAEQALAAIWREVLERPEIGLDDNFFDLGGDSLRAAQVVARVRDGMRADLSIAQVFAAPTIAELGPKLAAAAQSLSAAPVRRDRPGMERPLSFAQESMWFMAQFREDDAPAIRPFLFRLRGDLDAAALEAAIRHVIGRHEALRTRIVDEDGVPIGVLSDAAGFRLEKRDFSALPASDRRASAERYARRRLRARFDLARDLPFRASLARIDGREFLVAISMHHTCSDGWSNAVLYEEMTAAYRAYAAGVEPELPAVPLQYADFAEWQRSRLEGPALESRLAYWKQQLDGCTRAIRLRPERPRAAQADSMGGCCAAELGFAARDAINAVARAEKATPFVVLLAALFDRLHRWSGDRDLVVGSPVANRPTRETERVIGLFMNPLPLRCAVDGNEDFPALVRRVRDIAMAAFDHQDTPLEKIVEALRRPRDRGFEPIYRVGFQLRNLRQELPEFPGVQTEPIGVDLETSFADLALEAVATAGGMRLTLTYNSAVFDRGTAERLLADYCDFVGAQAPVLRQTASQGAV